MNNSHVAQIKRSQKESLLLRELSKMLHQLSLDDKNLEGLTINRVQLSRDKSICTVYFYDPKGPELFKEKVSLLVLYKPAMRKYLASILQSKYVPNIKFLFDDQFEITQRVEKLIDSTKKEFKDNE
ncbi:ribosome-binding factor A [Candidatus Dependentiae bacterium]|nr:ribosome-binding factor A [Candidatus Dependentiae bacterium]